MKNIHRIFQRFQIITERLIIPQIRENTSDHLSSPSNLGEMQHSKRSELNFSPIDPQI